MRPSNYNHRPGRIGPPIVGVFIAVLAVAGVWIAAAAVWWTVWVR